MKTYEDLIEVREREDYVALTNFMLDAIAEHKTSPLYREAYTAYQYMRKRNETILKFQKMLYKMSGEAVADQWSANYKLRNTFFPYFAVQEVQHLLGNGVQFENKQTKEKLGGDKFDNQLVKLGKAAVWGGVSFGFYNLDHVDDFTVLEFVPLIGEEDGGLHAGIRFWQIDDKKPLRITLYEEDGYTEYIRRPKIKDKERPVEVLHEKKPYKVKVAKTGDSEAEIIDGENYNGFPIVPLWANDEHQSEFEGLQEKIDCYDLIQSGFANDLDDASHIYWLIHNSGGMDDVDLAKFIERMKTVRAAYVDEDGSTAEAHTIEVPYQARKVALEDLKESLFRDAMALDTDSIANGNITATGIRAAYERLTHKCDGFETCVTDFIYGILKLAGIDDSPVYKRSLIVNQSEETQVVLSAAQYLDDETILKHLPFLNPDEVDDILQRLKKEEAERYEDEEEPVEEQTEEERFEDDDVLSQLEALAGSL